MHVLFLAPDTHVYNHGFVRALAELGVRVSGIGPAPRERLAPALSRWLADYRSCPEILDVEKLRAAAEELHREVPIGLVETIDEPLVEPAAVLRAHLGLGGLSIETARLCRDKARMKEFLRERGVACAQSAAAASADDVRAFVAREGLPVILKPIAGYGTLQTFLARDEGALQAAITQLAPSPQRRIVVEEFVEGHEGFFDTLIDDHGVRVDFAAHYYPTCLEALGDRKIAPQIAVTNRIEQDGYRELRAMAHRVIELLGLRRAATHMEWFFGPKGLKFSEIGARPAGEMIWDMYAVGNEFDVYREWALTVLGRPSERAPSRRYAVGSVQVRPDRDGRFVQHHGLDVVRSRYGSWIYDANVPPPGEATKGLDKGWLTNTWFRLKHPDYDAVRAAMTDIGRVVRSEAR
ncbi:MAG: acetyl-CoA carboxylase biotin carboxylase subunit family protein [Planctomycetota bacterium]